MSVDKRNRERKFHLSGWILFIVCAGFFIASATKADDILGLAGSIIFLIGCVLFIIPLVINGKQDEGSQY
jgi:membrane-bound ClpP family serine protease